MAFLALVAFAGVGVVASADCENVGLLQSKSGEIQRSEFQLSAEEHQKLETAERGGQIVKAAAVKQCAKQVGQMCLTYPGDACEEYCGKDLCDLDAMRSLTVKELQKVSPGCVPFTAQDGASPQIMTIPGPIKPGPWKPGTVLTPYCGMLGEKTSIATTCSARQRGSQALAHARVCICKGAQELLEVSSAVDDLVPHSPFSAEQQQCIEDYVSSVKTVIPGYDLSDRKLGGTSGQFPAHAKPPILAPGFGTTGTRSVCALGRQLGLKVHHYQPHDFFDDVLIDIETQMYQDCSQRKKFNDFNFLKILLSPAIKNGNSTVDMLMDVPISELFLDWYAASPDSKVLLTTRDPMTWANDRREHHPHTVLPYESPCGGHFIDFEPKQLAKLMEFHHTMVRCMVPPEKLLEVNIFEDDDTMKIATFVGRPQKERLPMPVVSANSWEHHKSH